MTGSPGRYRRYKETGKKPKPSDRIHPGYGEKPVSELTEGDAQFWLDAHPTWENTAIPIAAVKRMLNHAKDVGLVKANPIRSFTDGEKAKPDQKGGLE